MIWDELMHDVIVPILEMDPELLEAMNGEPRIFMAGANVPVMIPSVEWLLIGDRFSEVFNEIEVQFDVFHNDVHKAVAAERKIRTHCHANTRKRLAGIDMSMLYEEGYSQSYPEPGIVHRIVRFRFEPVRHRYALRVAS